MLGLSTLLDPVRDPGNVVLRPALHGSGIDELLFLLLPMVILAVVFLFAMRKAERNASVDESMEGADEVEQDVPQPPDLEVGPR